MSESEVRYSALNLLARREHSVVELRNKLLQRKFPEAEIEVVLADLTERNQQSDERFTECFIRSRVSQGYGPVRIKNDLQEKGVSEYLISVYLDDSDVDWYEQAKMVKTKKFGLELVTDYKEKVKQMRFLQYRGFIHEQIQFALGA